MWILSKRWSKFANAYSLNAEIYLQEKDTVKAAKWLDKSLELDPYDGDALTTRAYISLSRKQWKDADKFLSKAIHLKPKTVNNYVNRALARVNYNNLRGAMSDYDTALDLDPSNFLSHYNRGLLRMQLGMITVPSQTSIMSSRWSPETSWQSSIVLSCTTKRVISMLPFVTIRQSSINFQTSGLVFNIVPVAIVD